MIRMLAPWLCVLVVCWSMAASASPSAAGVGEFSIPAVQPLGSEQLAYLRALVAEDEEAKALAADIIREAKSLLDLQPHPLEVIHYEGLVNTDPRRIATVAKLREMADVATLVRYWQVSGDRQAGDALIRFIKAWTQTYKLTGNDVNENKFHPLLVAYDGLRDRMTPADRESVDRWVEALGHLHLKAVTESTHYTNRYTKHVRLLAMAGRILDRPKWIVQAHAGVKRFVSESLYADGTSRDLKRRDTLTYHASALKPPLELAMLAGETGRELYRWQGEQGGSLSRSVQYVVPYAMGEKTRREWTNSQVGLDHRRAEAGLDKYQQGKLYDPADAQSLMERASYFDPELMRVVHHLTSHRAKRFPTWQTLVNEAARGR